MTTDLLDTSSDANRVEFYRLVKLYGAPTFIKGAAEADLSVRAELPLAFFGDPRRRLYPLHTKAAAWANYGLFLEAQRAGAHSKLDAEMIESRILRAGQSHGITAALGALKQAVLRDRPEVDAELPDEDFAFVWQNEDGSKERHLPMRSGLETVKAAEYLRDYRDQMPYVYRRAMAERIREKVAAHGARLPAELTELVDKQAGLGACTSADVVQLLEHRVSASRKGPGALSAAQLGLQKLADVLRDHPAAVRDGDTRIKIASAVDDFDRELRLTGQVRDGVLPRVEDVLFSLTRAKLAGVKADHVQTSLGSIYHVADLEQLKLPAIRDVLGSDVADAVTANGMLVDGTKMAQILPTLDRGAASLMERLLEDAGVAPVAKQAAADSDHISNEYLAGLLAAVG